jgi:hypothetical protein
MIRCLLVFSLFTLSGSAQTVSQCRERFHCYLNHNGRLSQLVTFEKDAIVLWQSGKKVITIYENEIQPLGKLLLHGSLSAQVDFIHRKGNARLTASQRDSLLNAVDDSRMVVRQGDKLNLSGYRVAIDPGHFGVTPQDATIERKSLFFARKSEESVTDTIRLYESNLTFSTARILAAMLEEQGAEVILTRDAPGHTSFDCTYAGWLKNHRARVLDSLKSAGKLRPELHAKLRRADPATFYTLFFRDYEIRNRATEMNAFAPHASVIIHYNVDEKNSPWKNHTKKNFTMAFIPGAYVTGDLDRPENRIHFLRQLLTDQNERSEKLAALTVEGFQKHLDIPIAKSRDALYLAQNCLAARSPGVYSRNLILCRLVTSPVVYGESLYQDNEKECSELMRCDTDFYGVKTSERVGKVAKAYYEAVVEFLKG